MNPDLRDELRIGTQIVLLREGRLDFDGSPAAFRTGLEEPLDQEPPR